MNARRNADFLILRRPRSGRLEGRGNPSREQPTPSSFETPAAQAPQDEGAYSGPEG